MAFKGEAILLGRRRELCREIAAELLKRPEISDTTNLKLQICSRRAVSDVPSDSEILSVLSDDERKVLLPTLRRKPVRALSGVSVVAVMTAPFKCPHGTCVYCPGGIGSPFGDTPQSYTGLEPAARRGKQANYDSRLQAEGRINGLEKIGHDVSKIELIVMGGTFPATPAEYQDAFIKGCYDAANGKASDSIPEAISRNESSRHRIVGLTIETKPDWCLEPHVKRMLSYGTTRVELGVQTLSDRILRLVNRGHGVKETAEAFLALREAGMKIVAHMMPFLPGATIDTDLESFRTLFSDPRFMPDELKIYPTQVLPGTGIYRLWKSGKYAPPSLEETVELLSKVKEMTPRFVRIKRILRDIPSTVVEAGTKKSDIRELVLRKMRKEGRVCNCIRCREIGRAVYLGKRIDESSIELRNQEFLASGGVENFLTFDETRNDLLVGLLRLRFPKSSAERAFVRELHVYGWATPVDKRGMAMNLGSLSASAFQHKGYGKRLLEEAERRSREAGFLELAVTSGVGVREYYRKLGYSLSGAYMVKRL